jgi:hypothetical protein
MAKKYAVLRRDKTIRVYTPIPYTVDAYKDSNLTLEEMRAIEHGLKEHTKFLYDCLKLLHISTATAKERGYTLNIDTGEKLASLCRDHHYISHEMKMMILKHDW